MLCHYKCQDSNIIIFSCLCAGGKNGRAMRISTYDPDDPTSPTGGNLPHSYNTLDTTDRSIHSGPRVSTISQNYTEKTTLLSSDEDN